MLVRLRDYKDNDSAKRCSQGIQWSCASNGGTAVKSVPYSKVLIGFVVLGACSAIAGAQDKPTLVTYRTPATPAYIVIKDLSKISGLPIRTTLATGNDLLVISVKDVSISQLMEKIATVDHASWITTRGVRFLDRTNADESKMREEEITERSIKIKKAQDDILKKLQDAGAWDGAAANNLAGFYAKNPEAVDASSRYSAYQPPGQSPKTKLLSPITRLAYQAFESMNPRTLAECQLSGRVVFSTAPSPYQTQLDQNFTDMLGQFVQNQTLWAEAVAKLPQPKSADSEDEDTTPLAMTMKADKLDQPINRLELVVGSASMFDPFGMSGGQGLEVRVIDEKGNFVQQEEVSLSNPNEMLSLYGGGSQFDLKGDAPFDLCPVSAFIRDQSLKQATSADPLKRSATKVPDEIRAQLVDPVQYDPMSFFPSDYAFALGNVADSNLVGTLPDSTLTASMLAITGKKPTIESARKIGETMESFTVDQQEDWILINSSRPLSSILRRLDRRVVASMLSGILSDEIPTLDMKAQDALNRLSGGGQSVDSLMTWPIVVGCLLGRERAFGMASSMFSGIGQSNALLALYALLNANQKDAISKTSGLPLGNLNADQFEFLSHQVYFNTSTLRRGFDVDGPFPTISQDSSDSMAGYDEPETAMEPTDALPAGLPSGAVVKLTVSGSTVVRGDDESMMFASPMTAARFGKMMAASSIRKSQTADPLTDKYMAVPKLFKVGRRTTYTFKLSLTESGGLRAHVDIDQGFDGDAVSFEQLPEDFKQAVTKSMKETQEVMKGAGDGSDDSPMPPPIPPKRRYI